MSQIQQAKVKSQEWKPSNDLLGQSLHFVVGLSFPLIVEILGYPSYLGALLIMTIAGAKTFIWDSFVEKETFENEVRSMGYYGLGVLAGMGIVGIGESKYEREIIKT